MSNKLSRIAKHTSPNGIVDYKAVFGEMFRKHSPKYIAMVELKKQFNARRKISPEELEKNGMPETAILYREALVLFEKAYNKSREEQNLWS